MLSLFGIFAEALSIGVLSNTSYLIPTFVFSILMIIIACTRWGVKGIVLIPIMTLVSWICGKYFVDAKVEDGMYMYTWQTLVAMFAGNASVGTICILNKKKSFEDLYPSGSAVMGIALLFTLLSLLVQIIVICMCGKANYIVTILTGDIIGTVVTVVLSAAVRSTGVFINVKEKLLAERRQAQEDAEYEKAYHRRLREASSTEKEL